MIANESSSDGPIAEVHRPEYDARDGDAGASEGGVGRQRTVMGRL